MSGRQEDSGKGRKEQRKGTQWRFGGLVGRAGCRGRWGWVGLALLAWVGVCAGQDLRYLSHQAWGTEEGLPQSSVHAIAQTPDGYLWVATEGGLARFDGVSFKTFGRATDGAFESDDICCLKVEGGGDLLVGTASGRLRERDGRFERVAQEATADSSAALPNDKEFSRVQAGLVDREGLRWIGLRDGLAVGDGKTGRVQRVRALEGDSVLCVFEDAEGNHWVGTETSGLHVLRQLKFRSEAGLAGLAVTSIVEAADGAMWVGTRDDGLRRVVGGVVTEPVPVEKLTSGVILCLAADDEGNIWVGTPDGLSIVDAKGGVKKITSADGLPDDYVRSIVEQVGDRSEMWVGTQKGMARVYLGLVEQVLTSRDGLAGDMVGAMLSSGQGLLVGTSGGLSAVGPHWQVEPDFKAVGVGRAIVTAMALDRTGEVWLATKDGRLGYLKGGRFLVVGRFPEDAGVVGMTCDGEGNLWLRMKKGVRRVDLKNVTACGADGTGCGEPGELYGTADGLPTDEVVAEASSGGAVARDGEMWFPARRGVAVVDTLHLAVDRVAPPVVLERVLVADVEVPTEGEVKVPYGRQRLTLEYAGLSFTAPGEVRYRVKLEGFDKDWVDAGARRIATYTNLGAGSYTFRVQAVNGDGVWNRVGAEVKVRVVPPYWRRWWFIGLVLLGVATVLAAIYLLRLRRLRRDFEVMLAERNRMAREIHDTLTQDFVGTSLQLDLVSQMLRRGKVEAALEQVVRTRRLVTEGLDEARRSIWELRANGAEDGLPVRLRRLVAREEWAENGAKVKVGGAYRKLESNVERELLRVAQEALQNVKRHARATETLVDLHYSEEAVLLTIEDNGVGFAMEDVPAGHYGLIGMQERAEVVEGELVVVSRVGQGTKVIFRVRG
jgi:signal transduction histidine kinase/ligand-binding sensor domain-containing protein